MSTTPPPQPHSTIDSIMRDAPKKKHVLKKYTIENSKVRQKLEYKSGFSEKKDEER